MLPDPDEVKDALIRRARLIYSRGYTPREVQAHLLDEGHDIPLWTLKNWIHHTTRLDKGIGNVRRMYES